MAAAALQSFCSSTTPGHGHPKASKPRTIYKRHPGTLKQKPSQTSPSPAVTVSNNRDIAPALTSYMDLGRAEEARRLFEQSKNSDTFLWNIMIRGFADNGHYRDAVGLFRRMRVSGVAADYFTFPFVIKACMELCWLNEGKMVHSMAVKVGLNGDVFICNSLITMYARLGCVGDAEEVFYEMPERDLVSWNSMIGGYVSNEDGWGSLKCFGEMVSVEMKADKFSLLAALAACAMESSHKQGKEIHCHVVRHGFDSERMVQTSLIDMYGKCGSMDSAEKVFGSMPEKYTVVWNALIGGYLINDQPNKSFHGLIRMQEDESVKPDTITLLKFLLACSQLNDLLKTKSAHGYATRRGFLPHHGLERTLIEVYGSCGNINLAEKLFESMTVKSLMTWNTMIAAYARNGSNIEAIQLFHNLRNGELEPDDFTISSIIPAYSELRLLRPGKQIHAYVIKYGYNANTFISNSLIYMYAKCGDLESSQKIFDRVLVKDTVSWNSIIMAYGIHGFGKKSLQLFSEMQEAAIEPNRVTFISVLTSCSIAGLVDEGWKQFNDMKEFWSIDRQIEHYGCIVDLLGRTGNLDSALNFISNMPLPTTARIWGSLLTASRNNDSLEYAELAAEHVLSLKHDNTGCYVLLSNMYAEAERWEDVERIKSLMKAEAIEKSIGCCTIELNSRTYSFINGDRSHVETPTIYKTMEILSRFVGEPVSIACVKFRPEDAVKKAANLPCNHCLRLALSFGLISTAVGTPILIKKNIRLCQSCHNAAKLMSSYSKREIIVGDSGLFHHFKDGVCTCGDYW